MIVIELIYTKPLEEIQRHLKAHRDFLQHYYDQGVLVASGPKNPRDGGIIIALGELDTIKNIFANDPFCLEEVAEYRFIEFNPVKYCDAVKPLLV